MSEDVTGCQRMSEDVKRCQGMSLEASDSSDAVRRIGETNGGSLVYLVRPVAERWLWRGGSQDISNRRPPGSDFPFADYPTMACRRFRLVPLILHVLLFTMASGAPRRRDALGNYNWHMDEIGADSS